MVLALKLLSASTFIVQTLNRKQTVLRSSSVMPMLFDTLCVGQFGDTAVFYYHHNDVSSVFCGVCVCVCACVCVRERERGAVNSGSLYVVLMVELP